MARNQDGRPLGNRGVQLGGATLITQYKWGEEVLPHVSKLATDGRAHIGKRG